ncbi:hypothetical protein V6N13_075651 [Hibiscus sabdariffa]
MHATLGSSPSYTWRSIYSARGLLETGLGWKVGTGLDISVWNDAWLPGKGNGRLNLPIDIRFPKVSDLIIPESNVWNYGLLQSIFPSDIAARIGCIPLARSKPCDELIWRYDNTGLYSPKSGYKLLLEMSSSQHPINVEPNAAIMLSFYKSLWELNLPAKCKIFFWRLMHNFLPTFNNLQLRRLQVRNTCRFCEAAAESVTHFALLCPITLGILDSVGCSLVPTTPQLEFCETLASWFIQSTKRDQSLIVISYWALCSSLQFFDQGREMVSPRWKYNQA